MTKWFCGDGLPSFEAMRMACHVAKKEQVAVWVKWQDKRYQVDELTDPHEFYKEVFPEYFSK